MPSLFNTPKNRRFNYRPFYYKPEEEKRAIEAEKKINFKNEKLSSAMYEKWGRIPYSDIAAQGRRRVFITSIIVVVLILLLVSSFDQLEKFLLK